MFTWILTGLPYDVVHAVSNLILCGYICVPLISLLSYLKGKMRGAHPEI